VPSNPNALASAVDEGVITAKQLEVITKPETDVTSLTNGDSAEVDWLIQESEKPIEIQKPKEVSQQQLQDELDYVCLLLETEGMNGEVIEDAWKLIREILRLSGGDIPVDIKELINPEEEPEPEPEVTLEDFSTMAGESLQKALNRAQGAVD